ncbi:MAG: DUF2062 domain-containing protein [Rhodospirillaceae bacterium]|jgi:uncharacterized protein|nr:DUF2062 domain-containing protein [Rhodospirillaceae bacterium]
MAGEDKTPVSMETDQDGHSAWARFLRLMRYRLVVPILRTRHDPEFTARGVLVGVAFGLTPTVGIQIPIVLAIWTLVKALMPKWNFNLIVALAWVWLSNVFTLVPLYFAFLITGRIMMGHSESLPGYEDFSNELMAALAVEASGISGFWQQTLNLFDLYGVPMLIGCAPWAVIGGWLGYVWTAAYLRRRQRIAAAKRLQRGAEEDSFS